MISTGGTESGHRRRALLFGGLAGLSGVGLGLGRPTPAKADIFGEVQITPPNDGVVPFRVENAAGTERATIDTAGKLTVTSPSGLSPSFETLLPGEAQPRLRLAPGWIQFGNGTGALDVTLIRGAAKRLDLNGFLRTDHDDAGVARTEPLIFTRSIDSSRPGGGVGVKAMVNMVRHDRIVSASGTNFNGHALNVESLVGSGGVAAVGISHGITTLQRIIKAGSNSNEYTPLAVYMSNQVGTASGGDGLNPGASWLTDFILAGPAGVRPHILSGLNLLVNNYFNGSPVDGPSTAMHVTTMPWAPPWAPHGLNPAYPMDVGILVSGSTGNSLGSLTRDGFTTALKIGGTGGTWTEAGARFGTGADITAWRLAGLRVGNPHAAVDVDSSAIRLENTTGSAVRHGLRIGGSPGFTRFVSAESTTGTIVFLVDAQGANVSRVYAKGFLELEEQPGNPAAPSANRARIYTADDGSGKTRLLVRFPTGAVQQIAVEP